VTKPPDKIHAVDTLDWDHLTKIADHSIERATTLSEGLAIFAYDFTSTADEEHRNEMLGEFMRNATAGQSKDTVEMIVERLATALRTDHQKLRQFGKQNGVRLKRG
jgi:hypothetical protein